MYRESESPTKTALKSYILKVLRKEFTWIGGVINYLRPTCLRVLRPLTLTPIFRDDTVELCPNVGSLDFEKANIQFVVESSDV